MKKILFIIIMSEKWLLGQTSGVKRSYLLYIWMVLPISQIIKVMRLTLTLTFDSNYNYGPAGKAINSDLLNDPDAVANDPVISFKTAFWFWMTPQSPKPSCHAVITGQWQPSAADTQAGRVPGYGVITNIINGGIECGKGSNAQMENRIGFYKRYCQILGVDTGSNLDCSNQRPFNA